MAAFTGMAATCMLISLPTIVQKPWKKIETMPFFGAGQVCRTHQSLGKRLSIVRAAVSTGVELDPLPETSRTTVKQGEDELDISRVINGMWQVSSGAWGRGDPNDVVDAMLKHADAGLTSFDMADIYGPAEQYYGLFINRARRERGDEYVLSVQGLTKYVPRPGRMTRQVVEEAIDRSRKNMDVPSLDMVQFHWWDYEMDGYLDALKHMTDLKEEGKIKTIALTNFDTKRLQIIVENGIPVVSNQVQHSLVDMRPQRHMAELCGLTGVQLITYGTVLGGLLSDKFLDAGEPGKWGGPQLGNPSLNKYKQMVDAWGGWRLFQELLRECHAVARKHGVSISAVGVRYILNQRAVAGSMVGVRLGLSNHIKDSRAIFQFELDEEDNARIASVLAKGKDLVDIIGDCGDEYR